MTEKQERSTWYDNIRLAKREGNPEIIQDVCFRPWVTEKDEVARLQAIKVIIQEATVAR